MFNLKGRSLLTILDFTTKEINFLLDLATDLKKAKYAGTEQQCLKGKNIALIFEKASTRTRISFEVAALDQGAHVTYLGPTGSQMGAKETIEDTARVLGRVYDGIEFRGFSHEAVEVLARYSGVPVWNGLTDMFHPTQLLADFLTMKEHTDKPMSQVKFCYLGDARNNVANSLMVGAAKLGMDIRLCSPKEFAPDAKLLKICRDLAAASGGKIQILTDPKAAVKDVDFIYTDVWVSMGEKEEVWDQRVPLLKPYQVTSELMAATGNPHTKFLHCLPAFHNDHTTVGKAKCSKYQLDAMEVTEAVFESDASVVFDQAENRMHTIKAIMVATAGN